jgi:hypothetical protein
MIKFESVSGIVPLSLPYIKSDKSEFAVHSYVYLALEFAGFEVRANVLFEADNDPVVQEWARRPGRRKARGHMDIAVFYDDELLALVKISLARCWKTPTRQQIRYASFGVPTFLVSSRSHTELLIEALEDLRSQVDIQKWCPNTF